ncbi:ClbS/DfsB family four-helix bundle protein [Erysipelothrix urinaevulpis]|uniref:ClbS/DfsB family four-helix bundle protein n=1 Tax=Erysipelothrix urinaevulpis TaxID=2683717 RepID=UPI001357E06F|nr:ClbS/DfsB family four-helix bundle protein [Erysipelothrix urinaevulpis]
MARAKTKKELLEQARCNYENLFALIDSMSQEEVNGQFVFEDKASRTQAHWQRDNNVRDVLVHLYEWHQLILNWVTSNLGGDAQTFIPAPYNWRTYGDLNVEFRNRHQSTDLETAKGLLNDSHQEVMTLLEKFTDDELFTKGVYDWAIGSTLGSYFVSSSASHYDWATKKIKAYIKERKNA